MTAEYHLENGACIPRRVHTVVFSGQHSPKISLQDLKKAVLENIIKAVIPAQYLTEETIYHINPSGTFIMGGPFVSSKAVLPQQNHWKIGKNLGKIGFTSGAGPRPTTPTTCATLRRQFLSRFFPKCRMLSMLMAETVRHFRKSLVWSLFAEIPFEVINFRQSISEV